MDTKEYSNLLPRDSESILGASEDDNRQYLCSSCSEDIASVPEKKRLLGSKASPLMYLLLILLLTSNLGVIALWWKTKPTLTDCVRPLLAYSPAKAAGAYQYEKRRLVSEIGANVYTGAPRLAHDAAWARLL